MERLSQKRQQNNNEGMYTLAHNMSERNTEGATPFVGDSHSNYFSTSLHAVGSSHTILCSANLSSTLF